MELMNKRTSLDLRQSCPACHGPLQIHALNCEPCAVVLSGSFAQNEFTLLDGDDLHFLRIFIQAEGRIRDMEAPLGWTYPTIRARLSKLKQRLGLDVLDSGSIDPMDEEAAKNKVKKFDPQNPKEVLDLLEQGEISPQTASRYLKKFKNQKPTK